MTEAEILFNKITKDTPGAIPGKMFGAACIKLVNGKAVAIFSQDNMLFKLSKKDQKKTLEHAGTSLNAQLSATSKPMKGWILVPTDHSEHWADLTSKAITYITELKN